MKKTLAISIAGNIALLAVLWGMYESHRDELNTLIDATMRGDQLHLAIHAKSLEALESDESDEDNEVVELLRQIVSAGKQSEGLRDEWRRSAGLGG